MSSFDRTAAIDLIVKQNYEITALWGIYIAATFTGAAFSVNAEGELSVGSLLAVTAGFWAFVVGHGGLLRQAILTIGKIKEAILSDDQQVKSNYDELVLYIAKTPCGFCTSVVIHLSIDACVTALIWRSVLL